MKPAQPVVACSSNRASKTSSFFITRRSYLMPAVVMRSATMDSISVYLSGYAASPLDHLLRSPLHSLQQPKIVSPWRVPDFKAIKQQQYEMRPVQVHVDGAGLGNERIRLIQLRIVGHLLATRYRSPAERSSVLSILARGWLSIL